MDSYIREELSRLSSAGLLRTLRTVEGPQGPRVSVDGRELLHFSSNDYLGLANDPGVKEAASRAAELYGAGAGASRLVSGNMTLHELLEERIRDFKGTEAALLFNSGYNANLGAITALADRNAEIFSDRLNHASIVDACLLSGAKVTRYRNRDASSLERALKKSVARRKLVVTDGVFSMDGTIAPLGEITPMLDRYGATLLVDDAHATGVLGGTGRGTLEHFKISHPSVIQMGTLGKALGSFGAYIAGSLDLVRLLISKARPFIYTTALPPSVCAASIRALEIVSERRELRKRLLDNASYMRAGLREAGLDTLGSETQIIPVAVGSANRTMEISGRLFERGVFIQGIRPPTVPENTSRLRITVTAGHTKDDMDTAVSAIKEAFA